MATDNLLIGWKQQATQAKASTEASTVFGAANVLDEDRSLIFRSASTGPNSLEFVIGTQVLGQRTGDPSAGAPSAAVTKAKFDPTGRYIFAIENGTLNVYPFNTVSGEIGAKAADRTGKLLSADNAFALRIVSGRLLVAIAGDPSSAGWDGIELRSFDIGSGRWNDREYDSAAGSSGNRFADCAWHNDKFLLAVTSAKYGAYNLASTGAPRLVVSVAACVAVGSIRSLGVISFNASVCTLILGTTANPWLEGRSVVPGVSTGNRFTVATSSPSTTVNAVAVTNAIYGSTAYVAVGVNAAACTLAVFPVQTSSFGSRIDPGTLPNAVVNGLAFRNNDGRLGVATAAASSPIIYEFTASAGGASFGSLSNRFVPEAAAGGNAVDIHPSGKWALYSHSTSPYLGVLPLNPSVVSGVVDFVGLINTNWPSSTVYRVRIGNDPTFTSTAYDSSTIAAYNSAVTDETLLTYPRNVWHVLSSTVQGQYMRIDVSHARVDVDQFYEIGFVGVYQGFQPGINMDWGWSPQVVPLTRSTGAESGAVLYDPRPKLRGFEATLVFATEAEMRDYLHPLMMGGPELRVAALPFPNDTSYLNFELGTWGECRVVAQLNNHIIGYYSVTFRFEEAL